MLVNKVVTGFVRPGLRHRVGSGSSPRSSWRASRPTTRTGSATRWIRKLLETDGKEAWTCPDRMVQPKPPKACVRVEYDLDYAGGDYDKVGEFALIPLDAINAVPGTLTDDERLKAAFRIITGYDPIDVVHYTFDEVYDQQGNE